MPTLVFVFIYKVEFIPFPERGRCLEMDDICKNMSTYGPAVERRNCQLLSSEIPLNTPVPPLFKSAVQG